MPKQPPAAVARAMKARASTPQHNSDKLVELQATAAIARGQRLKIASLEQELKDAEAALRALEYDKLPALMDELNIDNIGVPPSGNMPGMDFVLKTEYSASIASSWSPEKKADAFAVLKKYKAEALIKTKVTAALPKGSLKAAKQLQLAAKKLGITTVIDESVHHGTLSAWLKELYVKHNSQLPKTELEKIGGFVGRAVKPVERKDD